MKFHLALVALAAALITAPAMAKDKVEPAINANTKASFEEVSARVRTEMVPDGRYAEVSSRDRDKVNTTFDRMDGLFQKYGDVAHMRDADKTQMFNDQELVNTILTKRDGERLICKNEMPVGSHIPVKTCRTAREMARERGNTQDYLRQGGMRGNAWLPDKKPVPGLGH